MDRVTALNSPHPGSPDASATEPSGYQISCSIGSVKQAIETLSSLKMNAVTDQPAMRPEFILHKAKSLFMEKSLQGKSFEEQLFELRELGLETDQILLINTRSDFKNNILAQLHQLVGMIWQKIDPKKDSTSKVEMLVMMLNVLGIRLKMKDMNQAIKKMLKGSSLLSNTPLFHIMSRIYAQVPAGIVKFLANNKPGEEALELTGTNNHLKELLLPLLDKPGFLPVRSHVLRRALQDIWRLKISEETVRLFCYASETKTHQEQYKWFEDITSSTHFYYKLTLKDKCQQVGMHWTQAWILFYRKTKGVLSQKLLRDRLQQRNFREDYVIDKIWQSCRDINIKERVNLAHLYKIIVLRNHHDINQEELQRALTLLCYTVNQSDLNLFYGALTCFNKQKDNVTNHANKRKRFSHTAEQAGIFNLLIDERKTHKWQLNDALAILWLNEIYPSSAEIFTGYFSQAKVAAEKIPVEWAQKVSGTAQ